MKLFNKKEKPHVHRGHYWDGYYERCKCGALSGDKKDSNGRRYIRFEDWPKS